MRRHRSGPVRSRSCNPENSDGGCHCGPHRYWIIGQRKVIQANRHVTGRNKSALRLLELSKSLARRRQVFLIDQGHVALHMRNVRITENRQAVGPEGYHGVNRLSDMPDGLERESIHYIDVQVLNARRTKLLYGQFRVSKG